MKGGGANHDSLMMVEVRVSSIHVGFAVRFFLPPSRHHECGLDPTPVSGRTRCVGACAVSGVVAPGRSKRLVERFRGCQWI